MSDNNLPPHDPYGQDPDNPGQQPGQGSPYGQDPYAQNPYGQPAYGQDPYGQNPYGQPAYGQPAYGQGGPSTPYSVTQSIGWAWRQFTGNVGVFLVLGLLMVLPSGIASGWSSFSSDTAASDATLSLAFAPLQMVTTLIGSVISFLFAVAGARAAVTAARGQRPTIGGAFEGVNWVQALIAGLLTSLAVQIGTMLCLLPGVVASFLLVFAAAAVAARPEAEGIAALTASFRLSTRNVGSTLLLVVLCFLLAVAGLVACCVGLFVAVPMISFATTHAFLRLSGEETVG